MRPPTGAIVLDAFGARRAADAPPHMRRWNDLAVLTAPDIHVATRVAGLGGEGDPDVQLAAAFAVRAVRLGHVCVDLATVAATASSELDPGTDLSGLPWPAPTGWTTAVAASPLVAVGDGDPTGRQAPPLRLVGSLLYLDRYWREECQVAADLMGRAARPLGLLDEAMLRGGLDRLFPPEGAGAGGLAPGEVGAPGGVGPSTSRPVAASGPPDWARLAAVVALSGRLSVIPGGPGTGKTTIVARVLALVDEQAAVVGLRSPRVAMAAPTGKAAARLAEAVHDEAAQLDIGDRTRRWLLDLEASTLHRLLGWRPDSASRFRHDHSNRLPHDVVVVDETSMLSLSQMASLIDAVRPDARLVLVGDPQQLASVEAGAVLGDIVGPAGAGSRMSPRARVRLSGLAGAAAGLPAPPAPAPPAAAGSAIGDGIVVLRRVHRFGGGIAELAAAVVGGEEDQVTALLRAGRADLRWLELDGPGGVRPEVTRTGTALVEAARAGRAREAMGVQGELRVLCAHRSGPSGVAAWNVRIERWLADAVPGYGSGGEWYPGRPLLVTENDYELQLYNGDTGVVVAGAGGRPVAVFERRGRLREVEPSRLRAVETLHAMTIHKSQGSQFDEVVVVLPDGDGPIVTRELLYTGLTRARRRVSLVGPEAVLRAAVARPIARASGLRQRLWGTSGQVR